MTTPTATTDEERLRQFSDFLHGRWTPKSLPKYAVKDTADFLLVTTSMDPGTASRDDTRLALWNLAWRTNTRGWGFAFVPARIAARWVALTLREEYEDPFDLTQAKYDVRGHAPVGDGTLADLVEHTANAFWAPDAETGDSGDDQAGILSRRLRRAVDADRRVRDGHLRESLNCLSLLSLQDPDNTLRIAARVSRAVRLAACTEPGSPEESRLARARDGILGLDSRDRQAR
ncbi:hypothetical protein B4N89_45335 [Embleya scabrispora]|uniref:Uncharacterized protein n=1 Tax=Embleya scabrispora TaxID=159449 RepID=A0A1T3NIS8_9ACTN|nr:hypothetical protein [Embleya scabrispora]OPC76713.1 hypothetical protein B4N89_45335 [Embleya scabrispora]